MPRKKILLVDDETELLKAMAIRLVSWGYDVVTASTGEQALRIFKEEKSINIIILDIMMPGIDGIETLKKIREQNKDIPILMLTAYASEENFKQAEQIGISGFVSKGATGFSSSSEAILTLLKDIESNK